MKLLNTLIMAVAVCSCAVSADFPVFNSSYTKTINPETITWDQLDPGLRKFYIKSVAHGMEKASEIMIETDAMAIIIKTLELGLQTDYSDLTGEYKAYHEASLPIIRFIIEDLKKEAPIPLPRTVAELASYEQRLLSKVIQIRAKYKTQIDEINRKYPNAAALFDSPQPGVTQPKIMKLFEAKYNIEQMTIENGMTSSSPEEAIRKTVQQLYALAEEQK